ncbi:MAG: OadG family protein [Bacteroidales bacterium]
MNYFIPPHIQTLAQGPAVDPEATKTFAQQDPHGFIMALLGMGIVFAILVLIYMVFSSTPRLFAPTFKQKMRSLFAKSSGAAKEPAEETIPPAEADLTGEINAAIGAAIHLYRSELHDFEDTVLTMKKVSKTYSPWSSKIYGLRNLNQR